MKYIEYIFRPTSVVSADDLETYTDLLSSDLGEIGFESFELRNPELLAYIPEGVASSDAIDTCLDAFPIEGIRWCYESAPMPEVNWNEEWEKNYFQPIVLSEGACVIRAPFHPPFPDAPVEIIINPKMAFGTGNHDTTSLIANWLLAHSPEGLRVLDMGCGTGILGLIALKRGAKSLTSVDIDEWAYENVQENARLNDLTIDRMILGDASALDGLHPFDLILANITRNILLSDMPAYRAVMTPGARLVLSGFYAEDIPMLELRARELGLSPVGQAVSNRWAMLVVEAL